MKKAKGKRINVTELSKEVANSVLDQYTHFIKIADKESVKKLLKAIVDKVGVNEVQQLLEITNSRAEYYEEPFCVGPGSVGDHGLGIRIKPYQEVERLK